MEIKLDKRVRNLTNLNFETSRVSFTSSSFEFSTFRHNSWSFVFVRTHTEMSYSFSRVSWTSDDHGVLTFWSS